MGRALFLVLLNDNIDTAKKLITEGAYLFIEDYSYGTPIHLAAQRGHESIVKLLDKKIDVDSSNSLQGKTPLMLAAEKGHIKTVRTLLEHGSDVNCTDEEGRTALLFAITSKEPEVADLLLDHGADPNVQDDVSSFDDYPSGISALSIAVNENFSLLLDFGLNRPNFYH